MMEKFSWRKWVMTSVDDVVAGVAGCFSSCCMSSRLLTGDDGDDNRDS